MVPRNYFESTQNHSFCVLLRMICSCVLCVFCCFLFVKNAHSQILSFKKDSLETVFQQIEKKTNWTFNYDPEVIADYSFTGKINLAKSDIFLKKILYNTPLEFETVQESVLIILPEKTAYRLCGYIKSEEDKMLLPGANIVINGTTRGTQTDVNGYFEIKIKAYKNQQISISYVGFLPQKYRVDSWKSGDCKTFLLKENSETLGLNIIVKDYMIRGISEGKTSNSVHLDYATLRKQNTYEEHDVFKTIQHLPGITSTDETATNLNIRGSTPGQNLVLWEGVPLYDPGHFYGMISAVNPFVISDIDVFKTPVNPNLGSAIGGVVDMSLEDEIVDKIRGGIGLNLTQTHVNLQLPIKNKLSLNFALRNSTNKFFDETPTLNSYFNKVFQLRLTDEETEENEGSETGTDSEFRFYDINAKIIYQISNKVKFKTSYFMSYNKFRFETLFPGDSIQIDESSDFFSAALSMALEVDWLKEWQSKFYFTPSAYINLSAKTLGREESSDFDEKEEFYNGIGDGQFGIQNSILVNKNLVIECGYSCEAKLVEYDIEKKELLGQDVLNLFAPTGAFHNVTTFADYQKDNLSIQAGLRNTYYKTQNKWFFSPRMTVQYKLHSDFKLKFSTGRFYQFISQIETIENDGLGGNTRFWVMNDGISDETLFADKIAFGGLLTKNRWLLDAEVYLNNNQGVKARSTLVPEDNSFDIEGKSTAIGLDILVNKNWTNYGLWANYSLAKHTMFFSDIQEAGFPADNDHRHNLSITGNFNFKKWQGILTWRYRSGLPYSKPIGYHSYMENDTTYYEFDYTEINNLRQRPYSRFDAAVSYKTSIWKEKLNLETRLSLINVFNTKNLVPPTYHFTENQDADNPGPRIVSIDKYLLGITPQFLVRFYW